MILWFGFSGILDRIWSNTGQESLFVVGSTNASASARCWASGAAVVTQGRPTRGGSVSGCFKDVSDAYSAVNDW